MPKWKADCLRRESKTIVDAGCVGRICTEANVLDQISARNNAYPVPRPTGINPLIIPRVGPRSFIHGVEDPCPEGDGSLVGQDVIQETVSFELRPFPEVFVILLPRTPPGGPAPYPHHDRKKIAILDRETFIQMTESGDQRNLAVISIAFEQFRAKRERLGSGRQSSSKMMASSTKEKTQSRPEITR